MTQKQTLRLRENLQSLLKGVFKPLFLSVLLLLRSVC